MRDFYEVLGVEKNASASDIKRAYRRLAMEHHPDRNPDDPESEEKFKEASNAYKILSDSDQRARYDRFGPEGINGAAGFQGFNGVDDIFSAFGDLFGDFFGGRRSRGPARGNDLRLVMQLTFAEAVHGIEREITVPRKVACDTCGGNGAKPGTSVDRCATCAGRGQVMHSQGFFMIQTACPDCRGQGTTIKDRCPDCRGGGLTREESTLTITIPAGIDDGQTLRLSGKGESPPGGGVPGDLYVVCQVEPDERFLREGADILSEVPISYLTAILGGTVTVPTLDDDCEGSEELDVSAGTQPGDTHIRRGQGIARLNHRGRGDHVVQFKVGIPKKVSGAERELLEELASKAGVEVAKKKGLFGRKKK